MTLKANLERHDESEITRHCDGHICLGDSFQRNFRASGKFSNFKKNISSHECLIRGQHVCIHVFMYGHWHGKTSKSNNCLSIILHNSHKSQDVCLGFGSRGLAPGSGTRRVQDQAGRYGHTGTVGEPPLPTTRGHH